MATLDQVFNLLTQLTTEVSHLRKETRKIKNKLDDPDGEKAEKRRNNPNNGFNRQRVVSEKMRDFLGMGPDETISRTDGTRRVFAYVRENNLKHPDNGKRIMPDEKMQYFLGVAADTDVSFSNIQKYLSPHYLRAASDPESAAEPDVAADPADANGDGRVTRSEAQEFREEQAETVTPAPAPAPTKKKVVVTKKKPVVRKPTTQA